MKATQTNMEESERDTERGNSKQEKDSNQPRQNDVLVPKRVNIIPLQRLKGRSRVVGVLVYADWNAPFFFVAFLAEL